MGVIFEFPPSTYLNNPMVVTSVVTYTFSIGSFVVSPWSRYGPSVDWGVECCALCHDPCNTVTHSHSVFPKTSGFHNCVKTVSKDVSNRVFICQQLLYTGLRSKNHSTHELDISIAPAILLWCQKENSASKWWPPCK